MYESREESSKVAGNTVDSHFTNIESEETVGLRPGYDYSALNKYGLIKENTPLDDKKVVIGRVTTNLSDVSKSLDSSVFPKKGQLGFVDKSFITEGEEGFRLAKVRIREERVPAIGDKFCSRCGQKGSHWYDNTRRRYAVYRGRRQTGSNSKSSCTAIAYDYRTVSRDSYGKGMCYVWIIWRNSIQQQRP